MSAGPLLASCSSASSAGPNPPFGRLLPVGVSARLDSDRVSGSMSSLQEALVHARYWAGSGGRGEGASLTGKGRPPVARGRHRGRPAAVGCCRRGRCLPQRRKDPDGALRRRPRGSGVYWHSRRHPHLQEAGAFDLHVSSLQAVAFESGPMHRAHADWYRLFHPKARSTVRNAPGRPGKLPLPPERRSQPLRLLGPEHR